MQSDLSKLVEMMTVVDKHLKTLVKQLKNVVETSQDPVIIESTQRQIKQINSIHLDIKNTVSNRDKYSDGIKGLDDIFNLDQQQEVLSTQLHALSMLKGSIESQTPSERNSLEAALKRVEEQQPSSQKGTSKKTNPLTIILQDSKLNLEAAYNLNTTLATSEKETKSIKSVKLGKRKGPAKENGK